MHGAVRDPVLLNLNELGRALDHLLNVEIRDSKLGVASVHASKVLINSVHMDASVDSLVGLDTFKTLNGEV